MKIRERVSFRYLTVLFHRNRWSVQHTLAINVYFVINNIQNRLSGKRAEQLLYAALKKAKGAIEAEKEELLHRMAAQIRIKMQT